LPFTIIILLEYNPFPILFW